MARRTDLERTRGWLGTIWGGDAGAAMMSVVLLTTVIEKQPRQLVLPVQAERLG